VEQTRLLIDCPDRPGLIAAVTGFLGRRGLNISDADQHSSDQGRFFMRAVFESPADPERFEEHFLAEVAAPHEMAYTLRPAAERRRMAIFSSKEEHCLADLLWRWRSGELAAEIACVVSNHAEHGELVSSFGLPFHHIPVIKGEKDRAEAAQIELLAGEVELVVLARYMQILSADFLERIGCPLINIHHSFLPAFAGAAPYERAHERGVKLIGATAHYVTAELDAGPIIDQDTVRVSHRDELSDLVRIGRDVERQVLARAVRAHLEDRVLIHGERTIVF
jgi:formyltetrahydrofolate deformylase